MTSPPTVAALLPILRPAQVLCVQRSGLVSRAIRWVTRSPWSHVALIAESHGAVILLEATSARGVAAVKIETVLEDPSVTALLIRDRSDLAPADRDAICRAAWLETGAAYDPGVNMDILWRRLTGWRGLLNRTQAMNCAELVLQAYARAWGAIVAKGGEASPAMLARTEKLVDRWQWGATIPPSD